MRRESYTNLVKKLKSPTTPKALVVGKEPEKKEEPSSGGEMSDGDIKRKSNPLIKPRGKVYKIKKHEDLDEDTRKTLKRVMKHDIRQMSNKELELLLSGNDDEYAVDFILERTPQIKSLTRERDALEERVKHSANYNYAREPGFVHDRAELRESLDDVTALRRHVNHLLEPILIKLTETQLKLDSNASELEDKSEAMAKEFQSAERSCEETKKFIDDYVKIRKQAHHKRILADKGKEKNTELASYVTKPFEVDSPIPMPRQRKRVSFEK